MCDSDGKARDRQGELTHDRLQRNEQEARRRRKGNAVQPLRSGGCQAAQRPTPIGASRLGSIVDLGGGSATDAAVYVRAVVIGRRPVFGSTRRSPNAAGAPARSEHPSLPQRHLSMLLGLINAEDNPFELAG
jgi:hypothetical protein